MKKYIIDIFVPITLLFCLMWVGIVLKSLSHQWPSSICQCPCPNQVVGVFRHIFTTPEQAQNRAVQNRLSKRVNALIAVCQSSDPRKVDLAHRYLGEYGSDAESALPHLEFIANLYRDPEVRKKARAAIMKINNPNTQASSTQAQ